MNNVVIEVLNKDHGRDVVNYFESKGADVGVIAGCLTREDGDMKRWYGIIDGEFAMYSYYEVKGAGAEIITLPEDPEYPKVMEVSDNEDFRESLKRVVFMEKKDMFLAWDGATTLEEAEDSIEVNPWLYAREIAPEPDIETFKINARDMETVTINARDTEFSWPQSNTSSHLLSKAFIIGAKEVVMAIREDLDELYTERDNISSRISEKERDLEFYNKKIKEFSGD